MITRGMRNKDWTTVELPSTRKQMSYTVKVALDGIIYLEDDRRD
jgi:hypothetical protein